MEDNIDDNNNHGDTEITNINPYLAEKLMQGRKDMEDGKGVKISIDDLWK
jgi:hypothetical protein